MHPHEYNVYDFTRWTIEHDGNKIAAQNGRQNPITQFAIEGKAKFNYPGWHSMSRWKQKSVNSSNMLDDMAILSILKA